ncbi:hypothetical protein ACLOJK_008557 [Asimina triloba]
MKIGRIRLFTRPTITVHRLPNTPSLNARYCIQPASNPSGGKASAILTLINTTNFAPNPCVYAQILSECCASKSFYQGVQIHAHITKTGFSHNSLLRNHLINLYAKCRVFGYAHHLLDENPHPNLVAWSTLVSGYTRNGLGQDAISAFCQMHRSGVKCNEFAFPSVLKACSIVLDLKFGQQVHGVIVVAGFECDVFVANTLMILPKGLLQYPLSRDSARQELKESPVKLMG